MTLHRGTVSYARDSRPKMHEVEEAGLARKPRPPVTRSWVVLCVVHIQPKRRPLPLKAETCRTAVGSSWEWLWRGDDNASVYRVAASSVAQSLPPESARAREESCARAKAGSADRGGQAARSTYDCHSVSQKRWSLPDLPSARYKRLRSLPHCQNTAHLSFQLFHPSTSTVIKQLKLLENCRAVVVVVCSDWKYKLLKWFNVS